jgi:hypothetical protein
MFKEKRKLFKDNCNFHIYVLFSITGHQRKITLKILKVLILAVAFLSITILPEIAVSLNA